MVHRSGAAMLDVMAKVRAWQKNGGLINSRIMQISDTGFRFVFPLAGITGPVILVLTDNIAAALSPGYDYVRMVISDLALGPVGWVARLGFCLFGILVIVEAIDLDRCIRSRWKWNRVITLATLMTIGFGFILLAVFNADPYGVEINTWHGSVHDTIASLVAVLFPIVCLLLAPRLKSDSNWSRLFIYTVVTAVIAIVLDAIRLVMGSTWNWNGLHERLMLWNALLWFEVVAINLLMITRQKYPGLKENHGFQHNSST